MGVEYITRSLIGALQRNAPLRGSIIMDSPFGRLDEMHTTKVIRSLPGMADQVLLLVYRSEIDPHVARRELKGHLKKEYIQPHRAKKLQGPTQMPVPARLVRTSGGRIRTF
jgi:DNA sulfur modification protein DndD